MTHTIRKTFTLPVGVRAAFSLLTDARKIRSWSGQKGTVQAKIGGEFRMFDGWVTGNVLAYQPGKHLAYTWIPSDWKKGATPSIVVYRFTRVGSKTRISLTHKGLPTKTILRNHAAGWVEHVVDPLKAYLTKKGV